LMGWTAAVVGLSSAVGLRTSWVRALACSQCLPAPCASLPPRVDLVRAIKKGGPIRVRASPARQTPDRAGSWSIARSSRRLQPGVVSVANPFQSSRAQRARCGDWASAGTREAIRPHSTQPSGPGAQIGPTQVFTSTHSLAIRLFDELWQHSIGLVQVVRAKVPATATRACQLRAGFLNPGPRNRSEAMSYRCCMF
jgi:hypothetical protein